MTEGLVKSTCKRQVATELRSFTLTAQLFAIHAEHFDRLRTGLLKKLRSNTLFSPVSFPFRLPFDKLRANGMDALRPLRNLSRPAVLATPVASTLVVQCL